MGTEELIQKVTDKLKTVFDPEIPVNVYDLGLIYDVQVTLSQEAVILMTLTAPNCPEASSLPIKAEMAVMEIPEIKNCKVMLTFDPPWNKDNLSEDIQLMLELM